MKIFLLFKACLFLILFYSSNVGAGIFISLAPGLINVDTTSASTSPFVSDFRLGYAMSNHQLELVMMNSAKEAQLNQLTVDVPTVKSVFYRYSPRVKSSIKVHLILGSSQIAVESSYPGVADSTDHFDGISYGIGLEESFRSISNLKIKFDWISLYNGEQLNINAISLGLRYEF